MNWLERARREIEESARRRTANSAERNLTAVMAVPDQGLWEKSAASIGSNGSTSPSQPDGAGSLILSVTPRDSVTTRTHQITLSRTMNAVARLPRKAPPIGCNGPFTPISSILSGGVR
jgi:hypothetical protein